MKEAVPMESLKKIISEKEAEKSAGGFRY